MAASTYGDACGVARSLDVIGERWALLVVRELVFGPKRFTDLRQGLRGISQNVLSQRLRDLEAGGVVRRTLLGPPASTRAYELTALGGALEPVLVAMSRWGALTPVEPGSVMSNDAFALALKALYVASDDGFRGRVRVEPTRDAFDVHVGDAGLAVTRAAAGGSAGLVVRAPESVLRAVMFGRRSFADAVAEDGLHVDGDPERAAAFLECFALPELPPPDIADDA